MSPPPRRADVLLVSKPTDGLPLARWSRRLFALGAVAIPLLTGGASQSAPPPDVAPEAATPPLAVGAHIQVSRGGQYYPATVLRDAGGGRYLVRYDNAGPQYDEVVGTDRIKADAAAAAGPARDYKPGEKVIVSAQNRVALADVLQQVSADSWRVHYDGVPPQGAENGGPDRIRRPFAGASAHSAGEAVAVENQGRMLPAKVLAAVAADKWLVRFDGFGPEYDQVLGAESLRAPGAAPAPAAPASTAAAATPPSPPPAALPDKPDPAGAKDKAGKDKAGKDKPAKDKATAKADPAPVAPPAPAGPLMVGEAVLVLHRGAYYPAVISGAGATAGRFKVKYDRSTDPDEELPAERLTRTPAPLKGVQYLPNQKVFIEWHGMLFTGKVLKESGKGQYKVRWDGTGPESDEVVFSKRLRPRT